MDSFPDLPLAHAARLELAEAHADRADFTTAIKLLNETLDKEPAADLADKVRLRLAMCHLALTNRKAALAQFEAVARNPQSGFVGPAQYRAAECLLDMGDTNAAVQHLVVFRDQEAFQNIGEISDRALLRLGHAYFRLKQWDEGRRALEQLLAKFGDSPWAPEARYALGWESRRQQKHAEALEACTAAAASMNADTAARALLLAGIVQVEQKHYDEALTVLATVPEKNGAADLSALALLEAAHAAQQLKQPEQAEKLLHQLLKEHPDSKWAATARERLKADAKAPAPHELAEAVQLLTPDLASPAPFDPFGQQQSDQPSLDDPTEEPSLATALARVPPEPAMPAPPLRIVVPEPFEYYEDVRNSIPADEERLPTREKK
jgi:TolA-binding protein